MNAPSFGTAALLVVAAATVGLILFHTARRGGTTTLQHRLGVWWAQRRKDPSPELRQTSRLDDEQGWTPAAKMPLKAWSLQGDRRIALGHPTDKNGTPDRSILVHSEGATPVGIVSGSTGSWKSSSILAEAAMMHGRDENGRLLPDGGAPMLLAAPKTELIELALKSRTAQGPVVVFDASNGETLPMEGVDSYGRHIPDLRPFLGTWSPLSECATWEGALDTALSMCQGTMGSSAQNGDFWEASAARLVGAAMWVVRKRGPGTCLGDVLDALVDPEASRGEGDETLEVTPNAIASLAGEIVRIISLIEGLDGPRSAEATRTLEEARLAKRAIADLVHGSDSTVGSICNTAGTALSATLRSGVSSVAWNDPKAIDIEHFLVDTNGTIAVVGSFSKMRTFRPITSAFLDAVRRHLEARAQANGGRLDRQVLVLIDELTTVTAAGELFSEWCASARSQRVQLLYATQDLAGLDHAFGEALRKRVVANTVTRLWLPGTADPDSLKLGELLAGEHLIWTESRTEGDNTSKSRGEGDGTGRTTGKNTSVTRTQSWRPIAAAGRLAAMVPGECLLLSPYSRHQLALRQWFNTPMLKSIAETGGPGDHTAPTPPSSSAGDVGGSRTSDVAEPSDGSIAGGGFIV